MDIRFKRISQSYIGQPLQDYCGEGFAMKGIDWLAEPDKHKKFQIFLEYINVKTRRNQFIYKERNRIYMPDGYRAILKFKNIMDDFDYFSYLCKERKYEDIWNYFRGEQPLQNDRFESSIGLFG